MSVRQDVIEDTIELIFERYATFGDFLEQENILTPNERIALKKKFLTPH